ncbi:MAG: hypothetical protein ACT4OS_07410 [Acidimicrobiales bacterium]
MSATDRASETYEAEVILRRVLEIINNAPKMPLSSTIRLERDEVVEMIEDVLARIPEETRQARWLLKERDQYLATVQNEAEEILEAARERAERIVQRTELVRNAQREGRRILEEANGESRRMRHEAEDYCDQRLASFEIALERIVQAVAAGREKLRVAPLPEAVPGDQTADRPEPATGEVFFDQDQW